MNNLLSILSGIIVLILGFFSFKNYSQNKKIKDVWKKGLDNATKIDDKSVDDLISDANKAFGRDDDKKSDSSS